MFLKQKRWQFGHLFNFNFVLIKLSILSEYLQTIQKDATTSAASTIHISMPHQVLKGIKPIEYEVVTTEIRRVMIIITMKYGQVIEDKPATKHSTSSGNIGNKNIMERIR